MNMENCAEEALSNSAYSAATAGVSLETAIAILKREYDDYDAENSLLYDDDDEEDLEELD